MEAFIFTAKKETKGSRARTSKRNTIPLIISKSEISIIVPELNLPIKIDGPNLQNRKFSKSSNSLLHLFA